jgi:hypothetical protein
MSAILPTRPKSCHSTAERSSVRQYYAINPLAVARIANDTSRKVVRTQLTHQQCQRSLDVRLDA